MNEEEIEAIAEKLADILEKRFNDRQDELLKKLADLYLVAPYVPSTLTGINIYKEKP